MLCEQTPLHRASYFSVYKCVCINEGAGLGPLSCRRAGFNLSPQAMSIIMNRHSVNGRIGFDEFVGCCTKLRALTGEQQKKKLH